MDLFLVVQVSEVTLVDSLDTDDFHYFGIFVLNAGIAIKNKKKAGALTTMSGMMSTHCEAGDDDATSDEQFIRYCLTAQVGVGDAGIPTHEAPSVWTHRLQLTCKERDGGCREGGEQQGGEGRRRR